MVDRIEVGSQVALAALLDTDCLELALLDSELVDDAALWASDGDYDVLASHPTVNRLVEAAVISPRPQVRATVASRPDLDSWLYPVLACDLELTVRARVRPQPRRPHGGARPADPRRRARGAHRGGARAPAAGVPRRPRQLNDCRTAPRSSSAGRGQTVRSPRPVG